MSISPRPTRPDLGPPARAATSTPCRTSNWTPSSAYRLAYGVTAEAYGLNLTDEVFGYYTGSPIFVNQREYYKTTLAVGFRYNLNRER